LCVLLGTASQASPEPNPPFEYTQVHMGMPVRLVLHATDESAARGAAALAFARIAALDAIMSDYRDDSELLRLSARPLQWVPVSADLFAVLSRAIQVARASEGAFDPSVGPLVSLWRDARQRRRLPDRALLEGARRLVGWQAVELDGSRRAVRLVRAGMRLDLGGIAKGYIVQQALGIVGARGIASALVEAGGDIVVSGAPPGRSGWAIDVPGAEPAFAASASRLTHAALATSGATAQFVEIDGVRYSHIVDPRTGVGVTSGILARVIAPDAMTADALATTLTIVPPSQHRALLDHFPAAAASVQLDTKSAPAPAAISLPHP
jgi:thiamine biosynthesis lipoprotein